MAGTSFRACLDVHVFMEWFGVEFSLNFTPNHSSTRGWIEVDTSTSKKASMRMEPTEIDLTLVAVKRSGMYVLQFWFDDFNALPTVSTW